MVAKDDNRIGLERVALAGVSECGAQKVEMYGQQPQSSLREIDSKEEASRQQRDRADNSSSPDFGLGGSDGFRYAQPILRSIPRSS
jgi:hypothetical protein